MVLWRRLDLYVVAGALAASIVTIWYASLPSIFDSPRLIGIATALWLATAIVWVADMARAQRDDSPLARRLLLAPALVVLVVVVSLSPWPERVRFDLSRGALDAAASRVALGQHVAGRIGGYAVTQDGIDGGVVTLHIENWSDVMMHATTPPMDTCAHLGGQWYQCPDPEATSD